MGRIRNPDKYEAGLIAAIEAVGGPSRLADGIGLVPSAVTNWRRVPAERARAISDLSGVPLHRLRPDLWDAPVLSQPAAADVAA